MLAAPRVLRASEAPAAVCALSLIHISATGVSPDTRVKDATEEELVKLRDYIEANFKVEGDLRREVQDRKSVV